jgi:hypothetical protein
VKLDDSVQRPASVRGANLSRKPVWLFQFNFPTDSTTVDATIAVSQKRIFEFYAKPVLAGATNSAVR